MKKKIFSLGRIFSLVILLSLLTGCGRGSPEGEAVRYEVTYLDLFDTVTTIIGYADSREEFTQTAEAIYASLQEYHRLFDIYQDYEGMNNLKTVNDRAGQEAVSVDEKIIDLLVDCRTYYELTGGRVNVAMGSVLSLWHRFRTEGLAHPEEAKLPDRELLEEAALHTDFASVRIDEEENTVFLTDPEQSLDVGAIAKGWAVQKVGEGAPSGFLISVGGNVCATGPKPQDEPWTVGIQSPDNPREYLHTLYLTGGTIVSSGDYQRYYEVEGKVYHHIIDPDTLYPSVYWRSVSIVCEDSGLADALSTALFLLPLEEGTKLLKECGAHAIWVGADGSRHYSEGMEKLLKE